jgi:hypothetical protein
MEQFVSDVEGGRHAEAGWPNTCCALRPRAEPTLSRRRVFLQLTLLSFAPLAWRQTA